LKQVFESDAMSATGLQKLAFALLVLLILYVAFVGGR
jgi:hypothetical protein